MELWNPRGKQERHTTVVFFGSRLINGIVGVHVARNCWHGVHGMYVELVCNCFLQNRSTLPYGQSKIMKTENSEGKSDVWVVHIGDASM